MLWIETLTFGPLSWSLVMYSKKEREKNTFVCVHCTVPCLPKNQSTSSLRRLFTILHYTMHMQSKKANEFCNAKENSLFYFLLWSRLISKQYSLLLEAAKTPTIMPFLKQIYLFHFVWTSFPGWLSHHEEWRSDCPLGYIRDVYAIFKWNWKAAYD